MSKIPLMKPWFPEAMRQDILADLDAVMSSGELMMGKHTAALEQLYGEQTQTRHAVSLSTATTGLQIALRYAEVAGGEVLVPAASFITDVSAVQMEGAVPVLVDVDPETLTFDLKDLEAKITSQTKAIIWVHLVGYIGEAYQAIQDIAKRHGLFLIEDASHAHGAAIDGKPAGSLGDVGVFSFYPTKIMTSGTGGMLVTDDDALSEYARSMRIFGKDLETGEIVRQGNDWFMDEFRACIGCHQARGMADNLARRRAAVALYGELLSSSNHIRLLHVGEQSAPAWYQYPVFAHPDVDADQVRKAMNDKGVACKQIYKPVHQEVLFADLPHAGLDRATQVLAQSLCLPLFADITDEDVRIAANTLLEVLDGDAVR